MLPFVVVSMMGDDYDDANLYENESLKRVRILNKKERGRNIEKGRIIKKETFYSVESTRTYFLPPTRYIITFFSYSYLLSIQKPEATVWHFFTLGKKRVVVFLGD